MESEQTVQLKPEPIVIQCGCAKASLGQIMAQLKQQKKD
jgi:hypothetical protein